MGIFEVIFSYSEVGKITKSASRMLNVIRRTNSNLSDLEIMFRVIEDRFGEGSEIGSKIIGNIYYLKFSYDVNDFGEADVKFGIMDILVYIVYFELGPRVFNDNNIIGKIGNLMREEGFTSKEINGLVYNCEDFPPSYLNKYILRKNVDMLDLNWRLWL